MKSKTFDKIMYGFDYRYFSGKTVEELINISNRWNSNYDKNSKIQRHLHELIISKFDEKTNNELIIIRQNISNNNILLYLDFLISSRRDKQIDDLFN